MQDEAGSADGRWLLSSAEQALVATKKRANRLGFAILLTFFRERGRFPRDESEIDAQGVAFVYLRARSLTDDLVDLLIETIHRIGARAERKVERELLDDLKRVSGKQNLLFRAGRRHPCPARRCGARCGLPRGR